MSRFYRNFVFGVFLLLASPLSLFAQSESSVGGGEQVVLIGSLNEEQIEDRRAGRGLIDMKEVFMPRGTWMAGGSASFSTSSFDNYSILLIEGVTSENYSFDVTPVISYSIFDNSAIGFKVKYGRSNYMIDNAALNLTVGDTSVNLSMEDYSALSHSYSAIAMWRQYIPLGNDMRFALYCDFQAEAGGFQSRFEMGEPVTGTFSKGWNVGVGVTPGIVAFATNRVAFDVSVGVMGISYTKGEQVHNQVSFGEYDSSVLSFAINIFSVSMGVSVYL